MISRIIDWVGEGLLVLSFLCACLAGLVVELSGDEGVQGPHLVISNGRE